MCPPPGPRCWIVSNPQDPSCRPFIVMFTSLQPLLDTPFTQGYQTLAILNLSSISPVLFLKCYISRIKQYLAFWDWHFSHNMNPWRFLEVFSKAIVCFSLFLSSFSRDMCILLLKNFGSASSILLLQVKWLWNTHTGFCMNISFHFSGIHAQE